VLGGGFLFIALYSLLFTVRTVTSEMGKPHHQLNVWQKAIGFVKQIYQVTGEFPSEEKFGLVSQMRRSAISIASNVSEGAGRNNKKEFNQFLGIAQGSLCELETQLIISRELGFLPDQLADKLIEELDEISKMIIGLQRAINK
jgi:four helix bundle protein